MDFTIDLLRTSANVRNSLTRIKTITGIPNWNIIYTNKLKDISGLMNLTNN